jgi:hypothetical protein
VASGNWTLDPDSEANVLLPWLDRCPDPALKARIEEWVANRLLQRPLEIGYVDDTFDGPVWSLVVESGVTAIWTVDDDKMVVFLADLLPRY